MHNSPSASLTSVSRLHRPPSTLETQHVSLYEIIFFLDYSIVGSFVNGSGKPQADGGAGLSRLKQNPKEYCQVEKIGEQEMIMNINGAAEWQHFNGLALNQGWGDA